MSIKNNTTSLQDLLDKVNALPDAENLDTELDTQATLISEQDAKIAELAEILSGKAGGSAAPLLQEKTVTPTTSIQSVTPDSDYDGLSKVTVNSIPNTYVKPNTTKVATTYTPNTSNQTIAAGTYCSGVQTIKGDANLIPANIVSGKTIFGVTGTATAGGGSTSSESVTITITSASGNRIAAFVDADTYLATTASLSTGTVIKPLHGAIAIFGGNVKSATCEYLTSTPRTGFYFTMFLSSGSIELS